MSKQKWAGEYCESIWDESDLPKEERTSEHTIRLAISSGVLGYCGGFSRALSEVIKLIQENYQLFESTRQEDILIAKIEQLKGER